MSRKGNPDYEDDIVDPDDIAVTLDLDDGSQLECGILSVFTVKGQDYIALLPYRKDGELDMKADILFYRFYEEEEETAEHAEIGNIESDEEFELVKEAFNSLPEER